MMDETTLQAPRYRRSYPREAYTTRQVTRLVQPQFHREGFHVSNLVGDLEQMLALGFGLTDHDRRLFTHILGCCIREADTVEGVEVSMSDRQWRSFVNARRKFLHHPDYLIWKLKTRLPVDVDTSSTEL